MKMKYLFFLAGQLLTCSAYPQLLFITISSSVNIMHYEDSGIYAFNIICKSIFISISSPPTWIFYWAVKVFIPKDLPFKLPKSRLLNCKRIQVNDFYTGQWPSYPFLKLFKSASHQSSNYGSKLFHPLFRTSISEHVPKFCHVYLLEICQKEEMK